MNNIKSSGSIGYADIPTVETPRLKLRAHRLDDLDAISDIWAQPETTRFIGGKPRSRSDIWQQLQRTIGGWAMLGFGYWAIELRSNGQCIGELGFIEGLRDMEPSFVGTPEAGWVLEPSQWGQGYATDALRAALQWRDTNIAGNRTVCIIEPDHAASINVAEKLGFSKQADTSIGGEPIGLFERLN